MASISGFAAAFSVEPTTYRKAKPESDRLLDSRALGATASGIKVSSGQLAIPSRQSELDLPQADDVKINDIGPVMRGAGNGSNWCP
jgi:hypothetical protein